MALSALKRKLTEQFLGHGSQHGKPHGAEHEKLNGAEHGNPNGAPDVCPDGELMYPETDLSVARLVVDQCQTRQIMQRELLTWLRQGYPAPPEQLWVAAQDLEHVFYPQFLAATEWPAYPWRTVAKHLRRITRTRQKDGRRGLGWGQHGSSPVEYMIRGPRKKR